MVHVSSKEQVYEYLEKQTKKFDMKYVSSYTTVDICNQLHMSRSLVSLYLNEMVKEGTVIKVNSRPVYYLNRLVLEHKYHMQIEKNEYLSILELTKEIEKFVSKESDFDKAIGSEGSLSYCIAQIKSALLYPGGLPILLKGEMGSGKTFLMKLIQEYCVKHKILKNPQNFQRIKFSSGEDALHYEELLFGSEDPEGGLKAGLLEKLDGGILYLENIPELDERVQERLADYITTGGKNRDGEKKSAKMVGVQMILSMDIKSGRRMSPGLLVNIPVVCEVPSWIERNEDERKEFIVRAFREEQDRLNRMIYISEKLIYKLVNYRFENNITELKKCIKMISANAYAQCNSPQELSIYQYHLPAGMLEILSPDEKDSAMVRLDMIQADSSGDKILEMWQNLADNYKETIEVEGSFSEFLERSKRTLKHYYDILIFQESFLDTRLHPLENIVAGMIANIRGTYHINFPANCSYVIARMLIAQQNHNSKLKIWERENQERIQKMYQFLVENMPDLHYLADLLEKQILSNINLVLSPMNRVFIMINIHSYNNKLKLMDTTGIVLCHGYTTASSIADVVNTTLQAQLFEAIDMPMESSIDEVIQKLSVFINENKYFKNIILMVDTGSLEGLGEMIDRTVNLGVINNVSTILALNIGNMILAGDNMQDILERACRENQCHFNIISREKKEKAIVFTSEVGKNIAEKLTRMFRGSLPKSIPLEMIAYDFDKLEQNGSSDLLFEKYEVVLLVKTLSLKIEEVNSVSLEEIINFKKIHIVDHVLSYYLNQEEIEKFDQALLKNFSLQSVMENLTILNAQKLLDYVSDATMLLQHMLKRKFLSKTVVGINMHICFLIERLVTKTPIEKYKEIERFKGEQQEFIRIVNESFRTLLEQYNVKLPDSEIAYLFEYIKNDVEVEENENNF